MMRKTYHGKYTIKNPEKYIGNPNNIVFRSSWEYAFMKQCDINPSVLRFGSEECIILYKSPVDGKYHRYFVDFVMEVKTKNGEKKKYLVEIKPYNQIIKPTVPKKLTESYKNKVTTYLINQAKWDAAKEYARKIGAEFIVLSERDLFNKR